ncbi:MAG: Hsp20/alpha crystallin family protein [Proteobacteria bacterium]|jgi:HSP20 family protein|nr:Hsp20/alpha crystallin family protein [Pseudomonadota bacterium]
MRFALRPNYKNFVSNPAFRVDRDLDRFFSDFFTDLPREHQAKVYRMAVDALEMDKTFELKFDLPGVKKEDLEVKVQDGQLLVKGERKREQVIEDSEVHRQELVYGRFERSFTLPEQVDAEKINAEFKDGVLHLSIPKTEVIAAKTIPIKVSS